MANTTSNVTTTGIYQKAVDSGDEYVIHNIIGNPNIEAVLSSGAPSETLIGHPIPAGHGIDFILFPTGDNDVYIKGEAGYIVVITK